MKSGYSSGHINGWREIVERVFEGFEAWDSYSPDWMVNPHTGRRLKLDRYFPELGLAVRFVGLQGHGSYRLSEEEEHLEADRNTIRHWLCQQQGVTLIQIDVHDPEPWKSIGFLRSGLSRTSRLLAQSEVEGRLKTELAPRLSDARRRCEEISAHLRRSEGMQLYSDLWRDRQYRLQTTTDDIASARSDQPGEPGYSPGAGVVHVQYGAGRVAEVEEENGETTVTIDFSDGSRRKFLVSLVRDKLVSHK